MFGAPVGAHGGPIFGGYILHDLFELTQDQPGVLTAIRAVY